MVEQPLPRWRRVICSVLYTGMIGVGLYLLEGWVEVEFGNPRDGQKVIWMADVMGITLAGVGLYLMWTDIVLPLFRGAVVKKSPLRHRVSGGARGGRGKVKKSKGPDTAA